MSQQTIAPSLDSRRWTKDELLGLYRYSKVGQSNGLPISEDVAKKKRVPELVLLRTEHNRPKSRRTADVGSPDESHVTAKQGQYLSFIYYYTKIHGVAPSEADMQRYFGVSAPSVHQMV